MTTIAELTINTPAVEWTVYQGKKFTVQVRAWKSSSDWHWNVYALIFDGHPLHRNVDAAMGLHFHWGATYDKRIVTSPAQGIQYEWQKISDCLKVGSDYSHCDDHYEDADPKDGIPTMIQWDAAVLAQELLERETEEVTA